MQLELKQTSASKNKDSEALILRANKQEVTATATACGCFLPNFQIHCGFIKPHWFESRSKVAVNFLIIITVRCKILN